MSRSIAALVTLLSLGGHAGAQDASDLTIARETTLASKILDEDRPILVGLPAGYETSTATYPVLYLLDGRQNMMHVAGSVELLARTGHVPPMIVVGIPSLDRERDLTPSHMATFAGSGGGPRFVDFIARELMPYIDRTYRTHPYRVIEGHSLGGALAAYALLHRPDLFDGYIIMSPSLWWQDEELTRQARAMLDRDGHENKAIFFGIGTEDGLGMRRELKRFVDAVAGHAPHGARWQPEAFQGEGHMSAPLLTNYFGLKMVFADLQLPETIRQSSPESVPGARGGHHGEVRHRGRAEFGVLRKPGSGADAGRALRRRRDGLRTQCRGLRRVPTQLPLAGRGTGESGDLRAALDSYEAALARAGTVKVGEDDSPREHQEAEGTARAVRQAASGCRQPHGEGRHRLQGAVRDGRSRSRTASTGGGSRGRSPPARHELLTRRPLPTSLT